MAEGLQSAGAGGVAAEARPVSVERVPIHKFAGQSALSLAAVAAVLYFAGFVTMGAYYTTLGMGVPVLANAKYLAAAMLPAAVMLSGLWFVHFAAKLTPEPKTTAQSGLLAISSAAAGAWFSNGLLALIGATTWVKCGDVARIYRGIKE